MLGFFYYHGWGVDQDNDEAFQWCKKADEGGNEAAERLPEKIRRNARA